MGYLLVYSACMRDRDSAQVSASVMLVGKAAQEVVTDIRCTAWLLWRIHLAFRQMAFRQVHCLLDIVSIKTC